MAGIGFWHCSGMTLFSKNNTRVAVWLLFGLLAFGMLSSCSILEKMQLTRKSRAWERRAMNPSRKMSAEERNQAWENEWKKRRQDQVIEEQSGGIVKNTETEEREDKGVTKKKKKIE